VIGLVGLCCKPQPLVIIIISLYTSKTDRHEHFISTINQKML